MKWTQGTHCLPERPGKSLAWEGRDHPKCEGIIGPLLAVGPPGKHSQEAWLLQPEGSSWDGSCSSGLRTRARCPLHQATAGEKPRLCFFTLASF